MAIVRLDRVSEEKLRNITWYSTDISVVWVGGRDFVDIDMEGVGVEGVVFGRSIRCHISSVTFNTHAFHIDVNEISSPNSHHTNICTVPRYIA